MDQEKVKAVLEWEEPRTLKALRGFLGLTILQVIHEGLW